MFCDCDSAATQSLVEPLEGFISYVDKYVCPLKGKYPLLMYIFKDENAMNEFFKVSLGETSSGKVFGRYISPMNAVVTYNGSGLGTMTHEIMHKVLDGGVAELDPWAKERDTDDIREDIWLSHCIRMEILLRLSESMATCGNGEIAGTN